jgi:hypothetical protein
MPPDFLYLIPTLELFNFNTSSLLLYLYNMLLFFYEKLYNNKLRYLNNTIPNNFMQYVCLGFCSSNVLLVSIFCFLIATYAYPLKVIRIIYRICWLTIFWLICNCTSIRL